MRSKCCLKLVSCTGESHRLLPNREALLYRNFSATVLIGPSGAELNGVHVMSTFRSAFSLLLTALCHRRSRTGAQCKSDSRATDKYPIQGANRTRLRKTAPNSGARKRETDTKQKGKQRAGSRSHLHPTIPKGTNPWYARPENLRTQQFLEGETPL